jgi:hypothetical protein
MPGAYLEVEEPRPGAYLEDKERGAGSRRQAPHLRPLEVDNDKTQNMQSCWFLWQRVCALEYACTYLVRLASIGFTSNQIP